VADFKVTKDDVIERALRNRYGTLVNTHGETIIPGYIFLTQDASELVDRYQVEFAQVNSVATSWFTMFTVPNDERWILYYYQFSRVTGSTTTIQFMRLYDTSLARGCSVMEQTPAASNAAYAFSHITPLDPGDTIDLYNNTAGTDPISMYLYLKKIKIN